MSSPDERAERSVAASDEPEVVVVRLTDDRAIVIGAPSGETRSRWGRMVADITTRELASLLRTLDPVMRAFIESRRLTGGLVELDHISRAMWSTAELITEEGGWIQATLRNRGQVARLMRIRPATGVAALSGGAAILGAIATQAQAVEMARDIKAIRQRVDDISEDLRDDRIGEVNSAVEQVDELVVMLRRHGRDGIEAGAIAISENELRKEVKKCLRRLRTAVTKLEQSKEHGSPRKAARSLSKETVKVVMLYLDLLGQLYAATVQLGLAQIALYYHEEKVDVARTRAKLITSSAGRVRTEIEDVLSRVDHLDESIRALFQPERWRRVPPVAAAPTLAYAARKLAGTKAIRVPGVPISPTAVVAVASVLPSVAAGANAWVQSSAEKELDKRLVQLKQASGRSFQSLEQATESLEVLRTLPEELARPGEPFH